MQVKIYVPQMIEIPSEYLPALVQRAYAALSGAAKDTPASRGQLVRQAVRDGLLRQFDSLHADDGSVDLFCDPATETLLEIDNCTLTLAELYEAMQAKSAGRSVNTIDHLEDGVVPRRKAA